VTDTAPNSGDRHDVQARVDELPSQMSPDENAGQLTPELLRPATGWRGGGPRPCLWMPRSNPERWSRPCSEARVVAVRHRPNGDQPAAAARRLDIPLLFGFDVIHGLRTIWPVRIVMAASLHVEIIEQGQAGAAREARAVGARPGR
jgi:beta-glucosidase